MFYLFTTGIVQVEKSMPTTTFCILLSSLGKYQRFFVCLLPRPVHSATNIFSLCVFPTVFIVLHREAQGHWPPPPDDNPRFLAWWNFFLLLPRPCEILVLKYYRFLVSFINGWPLISERISVFSGPRMRRCCYSLSQLTMSNHIPWAYWSLCQNYVQPSCIVGHKDQHVALAIIYIMFWNVVRLQLPEPPIGSSATLVFIIELLTFTVLK